MLTAVLAEFASWGAVETVVSWDRRLAPRELPATHTVLIDPQDYDADLARLAAGCDAALIIAPENDGVLVSVCRLVRAAGATLLGCEPEAIACAADKWRVHRLLTANGLATPSTWRVDREGARVLAEQLPMPLVVKPLAGQDCCGVFLVTDRDMLDKVLESAYPVGEFLLQRYVAGDPVSVSLLVAAGRAVALSLNGQRITGCPQLQYAGGVVPYSHRDEDRARALAVQVGQMVPDLRGYVGVDLVLSPDGPIVIEVNPRLTTSFVGLRQVTVLNLAQAIWQACLDGALPAEIPLSGRVEFDKECACG